MLNKYIPHQYIFVFFLCVLAFGISMGKIFMSISVIGLSANWLLSFEFTKKWQRLKELRFAPLIATLIFWISLVWIAVGNNHSEGVKDLTMKLPLLALPIILGTSEMLTKKQWLGIIGFFLVGIWINDIIGITLYFTGEYDDYRDLSIFISHIRLGILMGFSTLFSILGITILKHKLKYILVLGLILTLGYTRILESGTAYISVSTAILLGAFYTLAFKHKKLAILITLGLIIIGSTIGFVYTKTIYNEMTTPKEIVDINDLPFYTKQMHIYEHRPEIGYLENGYYLYLNISEIEVQQAWDSRSELDFYGLDNYGQSLQANVYRYLTSKGVKKDYETVMNLTDEEIRAIENGKYSIVEKRSGLGGRIEEILYEYISFQNGFDPNGHSIIQRLYYLEAGWNIFLKNKLFGVTKSDEKIAYEDYYDQSNSTLKEENRMSAHNQLLSLMVCYGLIGSLIMLAGWTFPFFVKSPNFLAMCFIIFMAIGFVTDDMFYRQAGVTIFAFFYSLLLFQTKKDWGHISITS